METRPSQERLISKTLNLEQNKKRFETLKNNLTQEIINYEQDIEKIKNRTYMEELDKKREIYLLNKKVDNAKKKITYLDLQLELLTFKKEHETKFSNYRDLEKSRPTTKSGVRQQEEDLSKIEGRIKEIESRLLEKKEEIAQAKKEIKERKYETQFIKDFYSDLSLEELSKTHRDLLRQVSIKTPLGDSPSLKTVEERLKIVEDLLKQQSQETSKPQPSNEPIQTSNTNSTNIISTAPATRIETPKLGEDKLKSVEKFKSMLSQAKSIEEVFSMVIFLQSDFSNKNEHNEIVNKIQSMLTKPSLNEKLNEANQIIAVVDSDIADIIKESILSILNKESIQISEMYNKIYTLRSISGENGIKAYLQSKLNEQNSKIKQLEVSNWIKSLENIEKNQFTSTEELDRELNRLPIEFRIPLEQTIEIIEIRSRLQDLAPVETKTEEENLSDSQENTRETPRILEIFNEGILKSKNYYELSKFLNSFSDNIPTLNPKVEINPKEILRAMEASIKHKDSENLPINLLEGVISQDQFTRIKDAVLERRGLLVRAVSRRLIGGGNNFDSLNLISRNVGEEPIELVLDNQRNSSTEQDLSNAKSIEKVLSYIQESKSLLSNNKENLKNLVGEINELSKNPDWTKIAELVIDLKQLNNIIGNKVEELIILDSIDKFKYIDLSDISDVNYINSRFLKGFSGGLNLNGITSAENLIIPENYSGGIWLGAIKSTEYLKIPNSFIGVLYIPNIENINPFLPRNFQGKLFVDGKELEGDELQKYIKK